jgi:hypothetical protein
VADVFAGAAAHARGMTRRPTATLCSLVVLAALAAAPATAAPTNHIFTVAGGGASGVGDGGPARAAQLDAPSGVAATADGGYLIADTGHHRVRRVSPQGVITTAAGDGTGGYGGDGGPATAARLNGPIAVAVTADGGYLIADTDNHRVRRVTPDGMIATVAGTGTAGLGGDGGPATGALLNAPTGVATTGDGGYLIADWGNQRVRRVSSAGVIATVAGSGTAGFGGDGGPATGALLDGPTGVATTADGGFLVADELNQRVRGVSPDGVISTVAGNGTLGSAGDGGRATAAQLNSPTGVAATAGGGFVVVEYGGERARRVLPQGVIVTVAGNGTAGTAGDGGPAADAQLGGPFAVGVTAGGDLLIADSSTNRMRRVDTDLRGAPQGPAGGSGTTAGPPGPTGPAGPPGPAGAPVAVERLTLAAFAERIRVRPGGTVRVHYFASVTAEVVLRVVSGQRTVARTRGRARPGRNILRVRAPRRPCRCRIALEARAGTQIATDRTALVVRRARG